MVNLIAGERFVPELIQDAFTPAAVAGEAVSMLTDEQRVAAHSRRPGARAGEARRPGREPPRGGSDSEDRGQKRRPESTKTRINLHMAAPAIEFRDVTFRRPGSAPVLDRFNLTVETGDVLALVGRSGAGKTTLLKLVNRLLLPDGGAVLVEGRDTRDWEPIALRRRVGYVLQDVGLFPHMTVADNVAVVPRLERMGPASRRGARARAARSGRAAAGAVRRRAGPTSCRAASASASAWRARSRVDPPMLLMDEPFGALDPLTRAELHAEFRRIQSALRKTVIIVTHDMGEAFALGRSRRRARRGRAGRRATARRRSPRRAIRASAVCSTRCPSAERAESSVAHELLSFWLTHRAELAALVRRSTCCWSAISTLVAVAHRRAARHLRRPASASGGAARRPREHRADGAEPRDVRVPAARCRSSAASARAPRIVVLILYGLLPIVRTTIAGLHGIDPSIREAGVAMGMTPRELLRQVELPLALPSIVAGIRVAAVVGVGSATIAAAIGAGGLGEYIYRGLSMVDTTVILAGAIPAALLALAVDGGCLWLERQLSSRRRDAVAIGARGRRCARRDRRAVERARRPPLARRRSSSARRTSPSSSCSASWSRRRSSARPACRSIAG